ncbi:MAG: fluoride efflux transporter CrcB [Tannerella sp.]|jgi:CrcB protein|nr:fluoride efflux transporter CrcB [Tannerella sp.]
MKTTLLWVGLGGAIGSMLRYATTHFIAGRITQFPSIYGTFCVNLVGSLLIGIVWGLSERYDWLSPPLRLFLVTGLCGGYTTFSAFAYENVNLWQTGNYGISFIYICASIILCLGATFLGLLISK